MTTKMMTCNGSLLAGLILATASAAHAQAPTWAIATWVGALDSYRNDPQGADRALIVGADGQCAWDYTVAKAAAASKTACTVAGDTVSLLTSAGSTIKLTHKNGKLDGTFQTKGGRTYLISMAKQ